VPRSTVIGSVAFAGLPFAAPPAPNIAAAVELIERIPAAERPDLLAIYPGWWSDFPLWFGTRRRRSTGARQVICGGREQGAVPPRWEAARTTAARHTRSAMPKRILDSVDPADLVSEKEHDYALSQAAHRLRVHEIAAQSGAAGEDLLDAARLVPPRRERVIFGSGTCSPTGRLRLLIRSAPSQNSEFDVTLSEKSPPRAPHGH